MKFDFSKAYRRIHYDGISAVRCMAVHDDQAYMQLRLSFGGTGGPASWCPTSEVVTDLANDLLSNESWHPSICHSADIDSIPDAERLSDNTPFESALSTMVLPSAKPFGSADVYIDDIIVTFLDSDGNDSRAIDAVPLAIETIGRPRASDEPIQREPLLAADKLQAEGAPAEIKTILGWVVNTRSLTIHLPDDKLQVWSNDINLLILNKKSDRKSLEQLVGRLIHASTVIPLSRYFL